ALSREYEAEMNSALKEAGEAAKAREAELSADIEVLRGELTERDRLLSQEKAKLVDELSKASIEAHERGEAMASAVKGEYEAKIAALERAAAAKAGDLQAALAEKEALLQRAYADREEAEAALRADLESRRAALEAAFVQRSEALAAEYDVRKERLASELAAKAEALDAETRERAARERQNWDAERARYERALEETSAHFRSAQKEIEGLNQGLRRSEEANAAREAALSRELMEAKSNFDKELLFRVKDAVAVQTAHLMEALEAAKAREKELADAIENKDNSIRALRSEAAELRRDYEARLLDAGADALKARREELESIYAARCAAADEEAGSLKKVLEAERAAMREAVEKARAEALEAGRRADASFAEMAEAAKRFHAEKETLQRARAADVKTAADEAARRAVEVISQKLRNAEEEIVKVQEANRDELALLTESFNKERDRMIEEMTRRENLLEAADLKIQDLEREMLGYRQSVSAEMLRSVSEQDRRFREVVAEEKARNEARIKQLEELLAAKERLLSDGDKFYRQKQLELDGMHDQFNKNVNRFNEELFAQKQELSEREKALNERRLKLEEEHAARNAELETMKAELARAIASYRSRK
ncbi:MAG: hypothetical protein M0025_06555, partial [Elusimicrobia bacterium]|nr:hypothetical protein [Elusimicrobiota bacterium]